MPMLNLVVGAKNDRPAGWITTDARSHARRLDIRDFSAWQHLFRPASIDKILCEHVLEHLSVTEAFKALENFYTFLRPGGAACIAVPDAFNPNPTYQEWTHPLGLGQLVQRVFYYAPDEPPHRKHYNVDSLSRLIAASGLTPQPLEWYDRRGRFHRERWDAADFPVKRRRGSIMPFFGIENMSLIVLAAKGFYRGW